MKIAIKVRYGRCKPALIWRHGAPLQCPGGYYVWIKRAQAYKPGMPITVKAATQHSSVHLSLEAVWVTRHTIHLSGNLVEMFIANHVNRRLKNAAPVAAGYIVLGIRETLVE